MIHVDKDIQAMGIAPVGLVGWHNLVVAMLKGLAQLNDARINILWRKDFDHILPRSHETAMDEPRTVGPHEHSHVAVGGNLFSKGEFAEVDYAYPVCTAKLFDLLGIYNVGGGTRGIVQALEQANRAKDIVLIGHDLSDTNRKALIRGTIDAVINQDPGHEVRSAVRVLIAKADNVPLIESQERIRIDIFLRDNLP